MTERKTIWYISKYLSVPADGSAGGRGYELMREFAAMGHHCVIITSDSNHLADVPDVAGAHVVHEVDGMRVYWLRTLKFTGARSLRRMASWLHFEWNLLRLRKRDLPRPEAVIVSSLSLLTVLNGLLLRGHFRARLIFEVRDIWPMTITEVGGYSPRNPFVAAMGMIERLGYRRADDIVGTMPNLGEHVANTLGRPRRTHCIPMGFAPRFLDAVEPVPIEYEKEYLRHSAFVVGYAGTVGLDNALESMFESAVDLRHDLGVHFLVVGGGDELAEYERKYADLPNLTFAPRVPKRMVQSVLSACDVLYVSTHDSEVWRYGQSLNKLVDYMLAGRPIIASYSGFRSMIDEAGCGTFVPAGDVDPLVAELRRYALMSAPERDRIGARGRDWLLANRSYPQLADDYVKILFPQ